MMRAGQAGDMWRGRVTVDVATLHMLNMNEVGQEGRAEFK